MFLTDKVLAYFSLNLRIYFKKVQKDQGEVINLPLLQMEGLIESSA